MITLIYRRNLTRILILAFFSLMTWLNFTPPDITPTAIALGGKLPPVNQTAPTFTLPTNTGEGNISLADFRGHWVVLYFYPKDFTSGCTIEARRFQQDLPKYLEKNTRIVGVSADSVDSHAKFCDSQGLKFPLLADTDGAVSKAYGSWIGFFSMRHTFIIDPQGTLREIFLGVNPNVHSQEVLARLVELQKTSLELSLNES